MNKNFLVLAMLWLCLPLSVGAQKTAHVDYNREVRHILAENCFACHGFDAHKRQAGLRLDTPEGAFGKALSGKAPLVAGKPEQSEMLRRILIKGPLHMPPLSTGKTLKPAQIATLTQWIKEGAKYEKHWAFIPPRRPDLPAVKNQAWVRNPIDRFILARLEKEGLKPSPEADKTTLIRRVSLDLTGLPPMPAETDAFLKDTNPNAYENLVDRLLASPRYGERMAVRWLDLARYADTHGYHIDSHRDMWKWREWVIGAYNSNMPFDRFTTEQIAGDLLSNPTLSQRIATGFNRNHPINFEGGAIPEEYQTAYVIDRIDTTATTFMGLTFRCAQCHDHKYDPFTQKDYYRFYAFFNTINEQGLDGTQGNAIPYMKAPMPEQAEKLDAYKKRLAELATGMQQRVTAAAPALAAWEKTAVNGLNNTPALNQGLVAHYTLDEGQGEQIRSAVGNFAGTVKGKAEWSAGRAGKSLKFDGNTYIDLGDTLRFERTDKVSYGGWVNLATNEAGTLLSRMDDADANRGWDMYIAEGKVFVHLIHQWDGNVVRVNTKNPIPLNQWTHVFATYDGSSKAQGLRIYINGKPAELDRTHDTLSGTIVTTKPAVIGRRTPAAPFKGLIDEVRFYSRELPASEVELLAQSELLRDTLTIPAEKRTPEQQESLRRHYLLTYDTEWQTLNAEHAAVTQQRAMLDGSVPTTMVMQEQEKPRDTFMLIRGQYDKFGDKVTAGIPAVFTTKAEDRRLTRLDLAHWLTDPNHPLTARVAVNRYWEQYFGLGLVKTSEDFGTQGEWPSHPELLDWLATEFVRTGWDVKAMQRLIVTSATYRQTSKVTKELLEKDPEDRLLTRGNRQRLGAEFIRDQALYVSGLLKESIGGPSVRPYHPAGLWEEMAFGGSFSAQAYVQDHGDALYRRSMYTFWKRTVPPPTLQTFDAPEREFCVVRRGTTNTPLQALILMNDPTYIEASRKLAERTLASAASPASRIRYAFRLTTGRVPSEKEIAVLLRIYNQQWSRFQKDKDAASKLLNVGESPRGPQWNVSELAAWTAVSSVLLNLDETITKS